MPNDILRLLVIAAVAFVAYNVLVKDGGLIKNEGTYYAEQVETAVQGAVQGLNKMVTHSQVEEIHKTNSNVLPHPQMSNNFSPQGNFEGDNLAQLDCFPKDQLMAKDLLPPEGGFADSNPAPQGQLMNRNLFESGQHAGLNTQSNTLKNANRQLRSDPLIPRVDVGPWHQSTYEADTNRRNFEIGSA